MPGRTAAGTAPSFGGAFAATASAAACASFPNDAMTVAIIESAVPVLAAARHLLERFQAMIRRRDADGLPAWLDDASASPMAGFARGLRADQPAVAAALTLPWSNGQTEGHITRLKLVKRQMYGRAKLDLLRARLIGAA
jgi:transposase